MRLRLGKTRVRVQPALIALIALTWIASPVDAMRFLQALVALALHEAAHIWMARRERVPVSELELTPFGGATRLRDMDTLRAGQIVRIALAGPAMSAALAVIAYMLGTRGWISVGHAAGVLASNALLFAFNMLPALPLDGGRVALALLGGRFGHARVGRALIGLGHALACAFFAYALYALRHGHALSFPSVVTGAFLIAAGLRERLFLGGAQIVSLLEREAEFAQEGALPIRWLAATADTRLGELASRMKPRMLHRVAVYDGNMRLTGIVEEETLLREALRDETRSIGALVIG